MDRAKQIRSEVLGKFFKNNGRMPTEKELKDILFQQEEYGPISKPMVPLHNAVSIADYTRDDLLGLIKDRNLIDDLLLETSNEISRVEYATNAEAMTILNKAELMLLDHQDNTFTNIYDKVAQIPGEADVANWYLSAQGTDSLYIEDDGTSSEPSYVAQWIELNSFNVDSGKEGISISPSTTNKLPVSLSIGPYAEEDYALLQTLSDKDPISIVASGLEGVNKGIELVIPINDQRISIITLDTNSITCSVLVDDTQLFTKTLDGPTSLSIGIVVKDHIKIRLYDTTAQVNVIIRDLAVFTSSESAGGTYDYGQYVSLQLPIDKEYGNILFNPDEYIPSGTSIEWYWSNSRITWFPAVKLDNNKYELKRPDESIWNTLTDFSSHMNTYYADTLGVDDGHSFKKIAENTSSSRLIDYTVKLGKGCILFTTKDNPNSKNPYNFTFNGFIFYIEVLDDTGYTFELDNPMANTGQNIFSNISISSEDMDINESPSASMYFDLPKGIHKIQLELASFIEFNFEGQPDGYGLGFPSPTDGAFTYSVMSRLEREFGAVINWNLGLDRLGRDINLWIEPYGVDYYDKHVAEANRHFIFTGTAKVGPHALPFIGPLDDYIRTNQQDIYVKYITAGLTYEVIPINSIYTQVTEAHSGYEVHYYSGPGDADWLVDMYHTPLADVILNENDTAYTPNGDTVTVPFAEVDTTLASKKDFLQYNGNEPNISFDLDEIPIGGTFSIDKHNIVNNMDLDPVEGIDEEFITFFPAGRALETFTSDGSDIQTPSALSYRPTIGYCLINDVYDQTIIEANDCTGVWVTGYCGNGESLTETACLEAGVCTGYFTANSTCADGSTCGAIFPGLCLDGLEVCQEEADQVQPTDKITCEAALSDGTAGTWTSTYNWIKYIMATSSDGLSEYTVDSFDFSTNIVTISGLVGTSTSTININYEYNEFQSEITQFDHIQTHEISSTSEIILLDRVPFDPGNLTVKVLAPGDITGVDLAPILDAQLQRYTIDLSLYSSGTDSLTVEDNITLKYSIEPTIIVEDKTIKIDNIPNTSTTRIVKKEFGTTLLPTAATTLTMEHPVAFREQPGNDFGNDSGPNSNLYIEVNGTHVAGYCLEFSTDGVTPDVDQPTDQTTCETDPDAGGPGEPGTWYNLVSAINGNVLTLDLSQYTVGEDEVQDIVSIMVIYESYEHEYPWKLEVTYDYYQQVAYSFNYSYNQERRAMYSEMWPDYDMRNYFFDISYKETIADDLYLKAILTSDTGEESPIIRRLRFERQ